MNLKEELFLIVDTLDRGGVEYALCGGMAVAVYGYVRATKDIDLLIRAEDLDTAERVLAEVGYDLTSGILPFDTGLPTERRVFRVNKAEGRDFLTLDLILVSPFLQDVWATREQHLVEGRRLQVVSLAGLTKMKRVAGRPQDLADLHYLEREDTQT
jgi:hypothetical protein